jgi:hypothetical protein
MLLLAVALVLVTNAGNDRAVGTRAHALNLTGAASRYPLLLQAVFLTATALLLRHPRIAAWCTSEVGGSGEIKRP